MLYVYICKECCVYSFDSSTIITRGIAFVSHEIQILTYPSNMELFAQSEGICMIFNRIVIVITHFIVVFVVAGCGIIIGSMPNLRYFVVGLVVDVTNLFEENRYVIRMWIYPWLIFINVNPLPFQYFSK